MVLTVDHTINLLPIMLTDRLRRAWRQRWIGVGAAWLACIMAWAGSTLVPDQFESSARLFVDADAVLTPLLRGIAADSSPTTQLEILQRTLLSRPNLEKLISKTELDLVLSDASDRMRAIARLSVDIKVTPQTKNLFTITYRDRSPKLAHDVVQTLLSIFVESATGSSRSDMDNARRFLENQIASFETQLRAAEQRRAEFRARYVDMLPNDASPDIPALESVRSQVRLLEGRMQDALVSRDALRKEVGVTSQLLVSQKGSGRPKDKGTKLQDAEEQLRTLLLVDTENHPDVIAQRRTIASLRGAGPSAARNGSRQDNDNRAPTELADTASGGDDTHVVSNPVYEQLKVRLVDAETMVVSLRRQRDEAIVYRDKLEKIQREQPSLVAQYQNLDRDYNVLRKNYEELLNRLQSANIAQAADTQADKVKLQVIDPPEIPRLAAAPNRTLLVTGGLAIGIMIGTAVSILLGQLDSSYSTIDQLRALGLPIAGSISLMAVTTLRTRLATVSGFIAALGALMSMYCALLLHFLHVALI
jgi:polysaccharide chain length determinant protein (PEP-CTERM system associated)